MKMTAEMTLSSLVEEAVCCQNGKKYDCEKEEVKEEEEEEEE